MFADMHTDSGGWLAVLELLSDAREELPDTPYRPTLGPYENDSLKQAIQDGYNRSFPKVSGEVFARFGERFLDGSWGNGLKDDEIYWARNILVMAEKTIWSFSPSISNSLRPTVVPFPDQDFRRVALWFCTEWWLAYGVDLHISEIYVRNRKQRQPEQYAAESRHL